MKYPDFDSTVQKVARANRHYRFDLSRHSDKGKTYCGFNAGLSMRFSEWTLIFQANHRTLNRRVPGSSPGAPTKLSKHLVRRTV